MTPKNFEITKEIMQKAKTYMPISDKVALSKSIADLCVSHIKTAEQNRASDKFLALPQIMGEDCGLKAILVQNTLLGYYLDIQLDEKENAYKQYDFYAGGHLLNQIERFKGDAELKTKAFDILTDFKEFKKMVDCEIFNIKTSANDGLSRLFAGISLVNSNPEAMKKMIEEIPKLLDEYDKKQKEFESLTESEKADKDG